MVSKKKKNFGCGGRKKKNLNFLPHKRLAPSEYILALAQWNRTSVDGMPDANSSTPP
jgi:hypothetical protein